MWGYPVLLLAVLALLLPWLPLGCCYKELSARKVDLRTFRLARAQLDHKNFVMTTPAPVTQNAELQSH